MYTPALQRMWLYMCGGGKRLICLHNNPSIDLLIFFSAFLKLLPFSKHFIQLNICKVNVQLLFAKHLVGVCCVGTYAVKLRSRANLCCEFF